jgi:alpha/beta superfamily hydrolase
VKVSFPPRGQPDISLEGELLDGDDPPCVVSHPHPLAGGDMHHPVVEALWRAAAARGLRALRYNFRGVGESTGHLTEKSALPIGDLGGAIDFLGGGPVLALAYSYGARTTLHAIHAGQEIARAALVALPTRTPTNRAAMSNLLLGRRVKTEEYGPYPDVDLAATSPKPVLILAGDQDPLVDAELYLSKGVQPVLLEGVNHFFSRRLGAQPPEPEDLKVLTELALAFVLLDSLASE